MDHAFGAWLAGVVIKDNIITEWFFFFVEKPQRAVTVQCIECKKVRRFPCTNPDYKIWIEKFQDLSQNASWFETGDYLHYTGKANLLWHWISNGRQLSGKVGHSITSPCSYWFHIRYIVNAHLLKPWHNVFCLFIWKSFFFYMQDTKNIPCNCCNTKRSHFIWYILYKVIYISNYVLYINLNSIFTK